MQNTIKSLIITTMTVLALSLTAVAQPQTPEGAAPVEQPVTTVIEALQQRETPAQPLVTQQDVLPKTAEAPDRPRGESRTVRDQQSRAVEKPLLEIHGF